MVSGDLYRGLSESPPLRNENSLRAWIFAIARHRILDWFRTEARNRRLEELDFDSDLIQFRLGQFESQETDQESAEQQLERSGCVWNSFRRIIENSLIGHYLRGETAEAIAASSGRIQGPFAWHCSGFGMSLVSVSASI